jgi:hypothetical protein
MHKRYWIDCILSIFQKERKKQKKTDRKKEDGRKRWNKASPAGLAVRHH